MFAVGVLSWVLFLAFFLAVGLVGRSCCVVGLVTGLFGSLVSNFVVGFVVSPVVGLFRVVSRIGLFVLSVLSCR